VVPSLVGLCASSKDDAVLANAVGALVNLAHHEANRPLLVRFGSVRQLVQVSIESITTFHGIFIAAAITSVCLSA
jgi:hypothetical protein